MPAAQLVQAVLRGDAAYLPAGQLSHTVAWPVSLWRWPATQLPQAVLRARVAENVPLAHVVQTVLRSSSWYLPCKHVVQAAEVSVGTAVGAAVVCVAGDAVIDVIVGAWAAAVAAIVATVMVPAVGEAVGNAVGCGVTLADASMVRAAGAAPVGALVAAVAAIVATVVVSPAPRV